jgi:hypothetical protein
MPRFVRDGPGRAADEIGRLHRGGPMLQMGEGVILGRHALEEYQLR